MRKFRVLAIFLIVSILLMPVSALASEPVITSASDAATLGIPATSGRLIVQLKGLSLASWWASGDAQAQGAVGKLDVNSPLAQAYLAKIDAEQAEFKRTLARAFPNARLEAMTDSTGATRPLAYRITFNGMAISLPNATDADIQRLRKLPGVKMVYPDRRYELDMYASLPLIGAATLWNALGGQSVSGEGIKIASVDTGVYAPNPFFDPTGYTYPPGFPKGDTRFTTPKVIVARSYFRTWDPPLPDDATPWPGPESGFSHGSHTSGTFAGNANTVVQFSPTLSVTLSGVAPRAHIMSYKVFYASGSIFSGSAFDAELVMAIDDAVADGADVINNSWGGTPGHLPWVDPNVIALEAAWDAGVIVSVSAGNEGPSRGSNSHTPGNASDKMITVAASTTSGTIANGEVNVIGPGEPPAELQGRRFAAALFGAPLPETLTGKYKPVRTVGANSLACDPLPANSLTGFIALIERGACEFGVKVLNAEHAGAMAAIVFNSAAGGEGLVSMAPGSVGDQVTISAIFVQRSTGLGMDAWYDANPDTAEVEIVNQPVQAGNVPDQIASFSSRGPAFGGLRIGLDVTAPGVNIVSAGYSATEANPHAGFGQVSGTSMSAPHVAGAAALLKQLHPDWTPAQVRSALMTTATWLDGYTIFDQGAGRIDLTRAGDPGITVDKPSINFGAVFAPTAGLSSPTVNYAETIHVKSVLATDATWDIAVSADAGVNVSVNPTSLTLPAGSTGAFTLNVEVTNETAPGDYTGTIQMTSGAYSARLIFAMRVKAPLSATEVLLIDNDFSDLVPFTDYAGYYTSTLEALGVSYTYYNADLNFNNVRTIPPAEVLSMYKTILWFTGDNFYPDGTFVQHTPPTAQDMYELMAYLDQGGNLVVMGQDFSSTVDLTDPLNSPLYSSYLAAFFLQDDVFDPDTQETPQAPSVNAIFGPFSGMLFDLSGAGDGAENQLFIDEMVSFNDPALVSVEPTANNPILTAISPNLIAYGGVGVTRASQMSLEQPYKNFHYRTLYTSFGLEGVSNDTGFNSREQLLGRILLWVNDEPSVTVSHSPVTHPLDPVYFTATLTSLVGMAYTRWDFGDGSPIAEFTGPVVVHTYGAPGEYLVRAQAVDQLGHSALSNVITVTVPAAYTVPTTTTLAPSQDTYINSWAPTTVNDGKQTFWTGHLDTLRGLIQFNTTSIPDRPVITGTLRLYRTERRGAPSTSILNVHAVTKAWTAASTTWNAPWDVPGAVPDNVNLIPVGSTTVSGATPGWVEIDITALVQMWVTNPSSNHGLLLRAQSTDDAFDGFATAEFWDNSFAPQLVVTYLDSGE